MEKYISLYEVCFHRACVCKRWTDLRVHVPNKLNNKMIKTVKWCFFIHSPGLGLFSLTSRSFTSLLLWRLIIQVLGRQWRPLWGLQSHFNIRLFTKHVWADDSIISRDCRKSHITASLCHTTAEEAEQSRAATGQVDWSQSSVVGHEKERKD